MKNGLTMYVRKLATGCFRMPSLNPDRRTCTVSYREFVRMILGENWEIEGRFDENGERLEDDRKSALRRDLAGQQWKMLKAWCASKITEVPEDTLTYKAMGYLLRHYDELTAYLGIAEMPEDNNDTEREIHNMVMGKQSYLFCRTEEACHRAALMYSMLGACKVLGKDAEKWLTYTLKNIGSTKPEDLHRLLPEEWTE